jgi:hypothetical protein
LRTARRPVDPARGEMVIQKKVFPYAQFFFLYFSSS